VNRAEDRITPAQWAAAAAFGALVLLAAVVDVALEGAQWWAAGSWPAVNPADPLVGLATGSWRWTAAASVVLVLELLALAGFGAAVAVLVRRVRRRGPSLRPYHDAARRMSSGRDRLALQAKAERTAQRLGIEGEPGMRIGRHVPSRQRLFAPWEALMVVVASAGRSKTTAMVIPQILLAPGAVIATSIKGDIIAATRWVRSLRGRVWVFDPQDLAGEAPSWWWNPLKAVRSLSDAEELVEVLVRANHEATDQARKDGFFDPKGQSVLAMTLLAAALEGYSLLDAYLWVSDRQNELPDQILREHRQRVAAAGISGMRQLTAKTADGIWATAEIYLKWVTNDRIAAWVTPDGEDDDRPQLDPAEFVRSTDTVYLLSMATGVTSASPVTTALTAALLRAADRYSTTLPGQRLPVPLCGILDEIANVCRWHELPDLYSHYRSKGIWLATYLQTWSQGMQLWGPHQLGTLLDTAGAFVYAGGVRDADFLDKISRNIGKWDRPQQTRHSDARSLFAASSYAETTHKEPILDVDALAALPDLHAVVAVAGHRPMLATLEPWWETELAPAVRESLQLWGQQADIEDQTEDAPETAV
jgi:type IV secretory pathway TraG/TraD family ATPase VirD4